jgi:A/G-specific adenine glycosylase
LPGIGPYTARAVSTFAFNEPNSFIETNIRSVFLFFFFPGITDVSDPEIMVLVEKTLYREDPRSWYYALMDYGSELKKKVDNPNRVSRHYAKQSKFEGSLRQARGAIVRSIGKKGALSYCEIASEEGIDYERIVTAGNALEKEGIISREGERYRFP